MRGQSESGGVAFPKRVPKALDESDLPHRANHLALEDASKT